MKEKLKMLAARFCRLSASQKLLVFISLAIALAVILFAILQIAGVFDYAACVYLPLMSASLCLHAYSQRGDRKMVTLSLVRGCRVTLRHRSYSDNSSCLIKNEKKKCCKIGRVKTAKYSTFYIKGK